MQPGRTKEHSGATNVKRPTHPDELMDKQQRCAEALRQMLAEWLADESGYDEQAWAAQKRGLDESRTSSRLLFRK